MRTSKTGIAGASPETRLPELDLVAEASRRVGSNSYQANILKSLVGKASVESILEATRGVGSSSSKYQVFAALARSPGISQVDADLVARNTHAISSSSYQAKVLLALVERASPREIRDAARHISSNHDRIRVLDAIEF